jgi:hypothetical protein
MKAKKTKPVRHIATRNGVPCSLDKVECRAQGFVFRGTVLFPLPLPPSDPHVFRTAQSAERAVERSQRLSRRIRQSIIRDFILARFPGLKSFATEASYAAQPHKKN